MMRANTITGVFGAALLLAPTAMAQDTAEQPVAVTVGSPFVGTIRFHVAWPRA